MTTAQDSRVSRSERLVSLLRNSFNAEKDHPIIHSLRRGGGCRVEGIRLHLSLKPTEGLEENENGKTPCVLALTKMSPNSKALYGDRLFDCKDTVLPLIKVKYEGLSSEMSCRITEFIAKDGVSFLGDRYHFFAYKDIASDYAFFFPIENSSIKNSYDCWQQIASFAMLSHVPLIAVRLGLLVSGSCEGIQCDLPIDLQVIDDILVGSSVVTDGSGFISADLAQLLPRVVRQGHVVRCCNLHCCNDGNSNASSFDLLPYAFQARVFSTQEGIFKGTLVVDNRLPPRTIKLRRSMKKVEGASPACNANHSEAILVSKTVSIEIVNTSKNVPLSSTMSDHESKEGQLNRYLVLLMHANGVPESVFKELISESVRMALLLPGSRKVALENCRNNILEDMIRCGQSLHEPYLKVELDKAQQREWTALLEGRIKCAHCYYLLGIPDPTGSLHLDEVYIPGLKSPFSRVVVARFPLHDPCALLQFRVVTAADDCMKRDAHPLNRFFAFTKGIGVIVFGTKASDRQSPENYVKRTGGDFDGDLYFVCGYQPIVESLQRESEEEMISRTFDCLNVSTSSSSDDNASRTTAANESLQEIDCNDFANDELEPPLVDTSIEDISPELTKRDRLDQSVLSYFLEKISMPLSKRSPPACVVEAVICEWLAVQLLSKEEKKQRFASSSIIDIANCSRQKKWNCFFQNHRLLVSKCAVAWLVEADRNGPKSSMCNRLAVLHDLCLVNRKEGYQLFTDAKYSERLSFPDFPSQLPHYLKKENYNAFDPGYYHSSSVLGRLHDYTLLSISEQEKSLMSAHASRDFPFQLDPDLNYDTISTAMEGSDSKILMEAQKRKYLQTAEKLFNRMLDQLEKLRHTCEEVDCCVSNTLSICDTFEPTTVKRTGGNNPSRVFRSKEADVVEFYRRMFDKSAIELQRSVHELPHSPAKARWQLAAAVYEVAYSRAAAMDPKAKFKKGKCGYQSSSIRRIVSIPWTLCGDDLNQIKVYAMEQAVKCFS